MVLNKFYPLIADDTKTGGSSLQRTAIQADLFAVDTRAERNAILLKAAKSQHLHIGGPTIPLLIPIFIPNGNGTPNPLP